MNTWPLALYFPIYMATNSLPNLFAELIPLPTHRPVDLLRLQNIRAFESPRRFLGVLLWGVRSYTHLSYLIGFRRWIQPSPRLSTVVWRLLRVGLAEGGIGSTAHRRYFQRTQGYPQAATSSSNPTSRADVFCS